MFRIWAWTEDSTGSKVSWLPEIMATTKREAMAIIARLQTSYSPIVKVGNTYSFKIVK